jgi:hypothetical protein
MDGQTGAFNFVAADSSKTAATAKQTQVEGILNDLKNLHKLVIVSWEGETGTLYADRLFGRIDLLDVDASRTKQRIDAIDTAIKAHQSADQKAETIAKSIEQPMWADVTGMP